MPTQTWEQTKSAAMSILGSKAKIPEPKANFGKLNTDLDKVNKQYLAIVSSLQAKILSLQDINSRYKNAYKQYQDQISRNDFGLDDDDAANKAKIKKAQDLIDNWLDGQMALTDADTKNLDELDKHSMAIAKYKAPV